MSKKKFILASASPVRLHLLKNIGIVPDHIQPAELDETALKHEKPAELAKRLAYQKAEKIAKNYPDDIILAADTVVAVGRRILPKAITTQDALVCAQLLSGRRHKVYTAISVYCEGKQVTKLNTTVIQFKRLTTLEIESYLNSNEWRNMAGGLKIEGRAESYIKKINGSYSGVMGLPLYETRQLLIGFAKMAL